MNAGYATHAFLVLLLLWLGALLLWSTGFAVYLNRIHSHGWASTRRLLLSYRLAAPIALLLCALVWEDLLIPSWCLAQLGRPAFQLDLARRYASGAQLLARNRARERRWLLRAAQAGAAQGQLMLGAMDWQGQGLAKPDPASALGWLRLAAAQGLPAAQQLAGEILLSQPALAQPGEGAASYFAAARSGFQAEAARGSAAAMFCLGVMQIQGHGLPADPEAGYRLLLQARARGLGSQQLLTLDALRAILPADVVRRAEQPQGPAGRP
jgi:TPR repeat protein